MGRLRAVRLVGDVIDEAFDAHGVMRVADAQVQMDVAVHLIVQTPEIVAVRRRNAVSRPRP